MRLICVQPLGGVIVRFDPAMKHSRISLSAVPLGLETTVLDRLAHARLDAARYAIATV
jgi:hypothetical protein